MLKPYQMVIYLALAGCSSPGTMPESQGQRVEQVMPSDDPIPPTSISGKTLEAPAPPYAGSLAAPFVATRAGINNPIPEAIMTGRFSIERGCLVFEQEGSGYKALAMLPEGSKVLYMTGTPYGFTINSKSVSLDEVVEVNGGEIPHGGEKNFGLPGPLPVSCPNVTVAIGGIGR